MIQDQVSACIQAMCLKTWVHSPQWPACPSQCLCIGYLCCVGSGVDLLAGAGSLLYSHFFTELSLAFQGGKFRSWFSMLSFSEPFHVFKETEELNFKTRLLEKAFIPHLWDELLPTIFFLFSKREVQHAFCLTQCDFHRHWHWHLEISSSFGPWYACTADSTALFLDC